MSLVIHGTSIQPAHMKSAPKKQDYDSIYQETLRYFDNLNEFSDDDGYEPEIVPEYIVDEEERRGNVAWGWRKGAIGESNGPGKDSEGIQREENWSLSAGPAMLLSNRNAGTGTPGVTRSGNQEFLSNIEPTILDAVENVLQRIRHRKHFK